MYIAFLHSVNIQPLVKDVHCTFNAQLFNITVMIGLLGEGGGGV